MRLTLIRHPAPQIAAGLCYGSSDIAVAPAALRVALHTLGSALAQAGPAPPIYSSPLQRCTALSVPLAQRLQAPAPRLDERLAEMDFGDWELRPWDSIARADIDAWNADLVHHAPGGGESVLQVATRVAAFVEDLRGEQVAHAIVVCHAGTIRLLGALSRAGAVSARDQAALAAVALQAAATPHRIDYASMLSLDF